MFTKRFWMHALENAIGRAAAMTLGVVGTDVVVSAWQLDYIYLAGVALAAGMASVLFDLGAAHLGEDKGTPRISQ